MQPPNRIINWRRESRVQIPSSPQDITERFFIHLTMGFPQWKPIVLPQRRAPRAHEWSGSIRRFIEHSFYKKIASGHGVKADNLIK